MRKLLWLLALGMGLTAGAAEKKVAEKKVSILFTGDNGGELAPCG